MKHTKGNWKVKDLNAYTLTIVSNQKIDKEECLETTVAKVFLNVEDDEQKANAILISAAPELLALAKMVINAEASILNTPKGAMIIKQARDSYEKAVASKKKSHKKIVLEAA